MVFWARYYMIFMIQLGNHFPPLLLAMFSLFNPYAWQFSQQTSDKQRYWEDCVLHQIYIENGSREKHRCTTMKVWQLYGLLSLQSEQAHMYCILYCITAIVVGQISYCGKVQCYRPTDWVSIDYQSIMIFCIILWKNRTRTVDEEWESRH